MSLLNVKNVKVSKEDHSHSKRKHKKKHLDPEPEPEVEEEPVPCKVETESESEEEEETSEEEEETSEEEEEESDEDDDKVSFSTTDILANDPLYFVLSKIFMTEDGVSLATLLQQMNNKLDILIRAKKHHE